jgi:hypothetical protein
LIRAIRRLARKHLRYGYKRIHARLVHDGWTVNRKRVRRLWNALGLRRPARRPKPKQPGVWPGSSANSCVNQPAGFKNDVWTYDFILDRTVDGRSLKWLSLVDEYTRECLALFVAESVTGSDVRRALARVIGRRGTPTRIRSDNGSEFIGQAVRDWLTAAEVLEYWKLDAELVALSACESALGRQGGGDGLLGFAQAFLLAGSRSVCLTLWQVDDTATVLLMDRFYRNLLGKREDGAKRMGKAAALHEGKQWLRNLTATEALERLGTLTKDVVRGERPAREEMKTVPMPKDAGKDYKPYAHPRYWAAFILIGDPE